LRTVGKLTASLKIHSYLKGLTRRNDTELEYMLLTLTPVNSFATLQKWGGPSRAVADFSGPVDSVLDGDNIEVLHTHHPERIRLSGIDCPKKGPAPPTASTLLGPRGFPVWNQDQTCVLWAGVVK
jgi:endonuclease YncB( thermonuclease family)